jgi:uncharacterized protein (DUF433 family)
VLLVSHLSNFEPIQFEVKSDAEFTPVASGQTRADLQKEEQLVHVEILQRYEAGETAKVLAREFGLHHRTVAAIVDAAGLTLRKRQRLSQADVERICALYESGLTTTEIAVEFGCYDSTIRRQLIRLGVQLRPAGRRTRN